MKIYEVFDLLKKSKGDRNKIYKILRQNDSVVLRDILIGALHPKVIWKLPPGRPPFIPAYDAADKNIPKPEYNDVPRIASSDLRKEARLLYLFVGDSTAKLTAVERERKFIEILESIPVQEAEILMQMVEKKFGIKGVTITVINQALPGAINI